MTVDPDDGSLRPTPRQAARPCPICGQPAAPGSLPFCSPRCADRDLNRWLSGVYVIPGSTDEGSSQDGDEGDGRP